MAELMKAYEPEIESFTLIPSDGGRFELTVNNRLLYSKFRLGRHANPGEVKDLLERFLKDGDR